MERTGKLNAIIAVNYATSNGTAVAGQDYTAAPGSLTYRPGEGDKTFSITVLPNPSQAASSVTVELALSQPTGGSTPGSPSAAVLTINNNMPPSPGGDRRGVSKIGPVPARPIRSFML